MNIGFLFGWAKEQGIKVPTKSDGSANVNELFAMYDEWKKKGGGKAKGDEGDIPTKDSKSSKTVDKPSKKGDNKLVLDDDDSRAVYERITSGKLYELDELYELPVFKKIEAKIGEYEQKYGVTANNNTSEREQLRRNWVQQFLVGDGADTMPPNGKPLKKEYKATIVVGLPAAGKSTRIANPLSEEQGAFIMDSDEMKKLIPEYRDTNGGAADAVHLESKDLMESALGEFVDGSMKGTNLVIPVIGDDAGKLNTRYIDKLQEAGYNVEIAYKKADAKSSANRVVSRAIKEGRFIPRDVVAKYDDDAVRNAYNTVLNTDYGGRRVRKSRYSEA